MNKRIIPKIAGYTKIEVLSFVKLKLHTDSVWAMRGCLAIFNQQTQEEQKKHLSTGGHNGCGFSRNHAPKLSSIACRIKQGRHMKQDIDTLFVFMPYYAAQLICISATVKKNLDGLIHHLDNYYNKPKQYKLPF